MSLILCTIAFYVLSSLGPKLLSLRQELGTYESDSGGTGALDFGFGSFGFYFGSYIAKIITDPG
jgi:hypothetical protein